MTENNNGKQDGPVVEPAVPVASAGGQQQQSDAEINEPKKTPATVTTAATARTQAPDVSVKLKPQELTSVWLSYAELSAVAETIVADLQARIGARALVDVDGSAVRDLRRWRRVRALVTATVQTCDALIAPHRGPQVESVAAAAAGALAAKEAVTSAISAVSESLTAVSKLITLFKTETSVEQSNVKTDDDALAAAVCGALVAANSDMEVRSTRLLFPDGPGLAGLIAQLLEKRNEALQLAREKADDKALQTVLARVTGIIDDIMKRIEVFASGEIAESLTNGEAVDAQFKESPDAPGDSCLLALKAIAAGGDRLTIKRHFFASTEVWVNGVVIVSYTLTDADARILAAGNVQSHSGYQEYATLRRGIWARKRGRTATPNPGTIKAGQRG